ncbi:hypothetical protein Kfla_3497 [Kribbella flavida DSM 17836]|uniref:Uncharacterized protein n=1 Tax=Kribbella flavida (strain DSM 17836 / JCM 10339 / NBRC 14399) TaxID=479435 RepID=D2PLX5_KRIFD|nr:hypothetical protein [Kribbella flavida]ADB32555.1 hypothetical protein Kfla_3497 [Kribbella flavida DSM 17836]
MNLFAFADLLASRGLRLLPGSHAVPVELLIQLPDATIARFTARGTTLRLRQYAATALTSVVIAAECGCGDHHPQTGPNRVTLSAYAEPLAERLIDGELIFGWTRHEAGLLRLADTAPYLFDLLAALPQPVARARHAVAAEHRNLVGVA